MLTKSEIISNPTKPVVPDVEADNIPWNLKAEPRWLRWKFHWKDRYKDSNGQWQPLEKPQWTKLPLDYRTGETENAHDTEIWTSFDEVIDSVHGDGPGFVLGGEWIGVDLDNCRNPETGELTPLAMDIINALPIYWEVSPSATGIKGIGRGQIPGSIQGTKNTEGTVEFYAANRYFTITGMRLADIVEDCATDFIEDCTADLIAVHRRYIGSQQTQTQAPVASNESASIGELVEAILPLKPKEGENDGSRRLYAVACRIVELNGSDANAIAAVHCYEQTYPFPRKWNDSEILKRIRDAEKQVVRGSKCKPSEQPDFVFLDMLDVVNGDWSEEFLIAQVLAKRKPQIIGGAEKCLKTATAVDMGYSLATGQPFFGQFEVLQKCRVMMMSGESAFDDLSARLTALIAARPAGYEPGSFILSEQLPYLYRPLDSFKQHLIERKPDVLIIDPAYLAMDGENANNHFQMGKQLRPISELCRELGITLIILHHGTKESARKNQPLKLGDLSWAGFREWARQWILLSRRVDYVEGSGIHELFLKYGGSRRSGVVDVTINEGSYDDPQWEVGLTTFQDRVDAEYQNFIDKLRAWAPKEGESNWPMAWTGIRDRIGIGEAIIKINLPFAVQRGDVVILDNGKLWQSRAKYQLHTESETNE